MRCKTTTDVQSQQQENKTIKATQKMKIDEMEIDAELTQTTLEQTSDASWKRHSER